MEEENFPRGGVRPRLPVKRAKIEDNLFAPAKQPKIKKRKKEHKVTTDVVNENTFRSSLNIQGTLTYNKIKTDMIILGCVRHITNFSLEIELPGLTFGYVNITNISDSFTKFLNTKLEQSEDSDTLLKSIFKVGQFVLTKIINIENNDKGIHVECSLNPRDIYNGKAHNSFEKEMIIWGSIQTELEHGFEINVGIKNCRVFLPSTNCDSDKKFVVGEVHWFVIHKCEISNTATTLRVSSKSVHLNKNVEDLKNLYDLLPGMRMQVMVDKVQNSGLQCKFFNDFFGYIDESYLKKELSKYSEGNLLDAIVLYTDHTIKVTYFTTFELDFVQKPEYNNGEIVIAEVVSKTHNGVLLKLPSKERCLVTNKRLINSLPKKISNIDISETIRLKFVPKSKHKCRILDYNRLSRTYVGTLEQSLIKETKFAATDVAPGELVDVIIEKIKPEGLVVSAGHIKGFIPNLYISNVQYTDNIKKKYREGQKSKARILSISEGNILLTLKSGQVESDKCLTHTNQAVKGDQYPGVVIQTKPNGALVAFYANVKGWISRKNLDGERNIDLKPDPQLYFYRGQVVNPWILEVEDDKIQLTLRPPKDAKRIGSIKVGQKISGFISKIKKDKIHVKNKKGVPFGFVHVNHLSSNIAICPTILKTYKIGDKIDNLMCINNSTTPLELSRRECLANNRNPKIKVKKFEQLRAGNIVRCSYLSDCERGIYVMPLIVDHQEKILIKKKDIVDKDQQMPKFAPFQSIVGKILEIDQETKKIHLTTKLNVVFNNSVEEALGLFSEYLSDLRSIDTFGKDNNWELCQYRPGKRVSCCVDRLGDQGGCVVKLPNEAVGLVAPRLCPNGLKIGQTIEGVVLSPNYPGNYVEVCLKPDICQRINPFQTGNINLSNKSSCIVDNILLRDTSALALIKEKGGNRQLVHIPLILHENDFDTCLKYYEQNKYKICVCGKVGSLLIGMHKKLFKTLDKTKEKIVELRTLRKQSKVEEMTQSVKESKDKNSISEDEGIESSEYDEIEHVNEGPGSAEDTEDEEEMDIDENDAVEDVVAEEIDEEMELPNAEEEIKDNDAEYSDNDEEEESNNIIEDEKLSKNPSRPILSGISSFFNVNSKKEEPEESSDEESQDTTASKKKKLSPSERAQLIKEEEQRISKIEKELADPTKTPETAEQFDRLLLANPNSSELWTKYIAFHAAATEFDKARAVAKRALDAINMTLTEEKFNIWIALLNLENMLGTKESFDKTFEEAIRCNDSLEVYLKVIKMLADSGKLDDLELKIKKVTSKYKQVPKMWLEVAKIYYQLGNFKEARNIKDSALKSIDNKKIQLEIIVKFAIMEFQMGDVDQGSAIFETILSTDPKKVTIWTTYVDQLVKKNKIDEARLVLDRAVSLNLPLKVMKTLFLKFRMFEEKHGTPDNVETIKERAKLFASKVSNK